MLKFRKIIALALAVLMLVCVSGCDAVTRLFNNNGGSTIEYKSDKAPLNSPVEMPSYFVRWLDYNAPEYDENGDYITTAVTEPHKFGALRVDIPEKLDFLKNQTVGNKILKQVTDLIEQKVELAESMFEGEPAPEGYNSVSMYIPQIINNIAQVNVYINIEGYVYFSRTYMFDLETGLAIGPDMIFADDFDWQYELSQRVALRALADSDRYDIDGYAQMPFKGLDDKYYLSFDSSGINVNQEHTYEYFFGNAGFFDYAQFDGQIALFERYPAVVKDLYTMGRPQHEFFIESPRVTVEEKYDEVQNGIYVNESLSLPNALSDEVRQSILDIYNTRDIYDSIKNINPSGYAYYNVRLYADAFAGYIVVSNYEDFYSEFEGLLSDRKLYIIDAATNQRVECLDFFKTDVDIDGIVVENFINGLEFQRLNNPEVYEQLLELAQSGRLLEGGYRLNLSSFGFTVDFLSGELEGIYYEAGEIPFDEIGIENLTLFD